ncbi:hypothetical protein ERJ75_001040900 [Trypanosoma vivax]|uniref:Uncharacterized protein n=1 Tax=Trypanosoma vivax (strain Y486) TaxID=1055687 RepID=G0TUW7_TRYVY|nr:hypothetical protein ERJ75_001040900 [Trypanosoma vivax]CCC47754.1 conserved hypothetical protein [Trypanosoma vivax Y486]
MVMWTQATNILLPTVLLLVLAVTVTEYMLNRRRQRLVEMQRRGVERRRMGTDGDMLMHTRLQRLTRQAIVRLAAHGRVATGIPLAFVVGLTEALADGGLTNQPVDTVQVVLLPMPDGTRATMSSVVRRARAYGPPPSALPAPTVLALLTGLSRDHRSQSELRPSNTEPVLSSIDDLVERMERELEALRLTDAEPPDATGVYGAGAAYAPNPLNRHTSPDGSHSPGSCHVAVPLVPCR